MVGALFQWQRGIARFRGRRGFDALRIHTSESGDAVVVRLEGAADMVAEYDLRAALDNAVSRARGLLVVDISKLTFVDSWGFDALTYAHVESTRRGIAFALPGASRYFARMWAATHADTRPIRYATVGDAVGALADPRRRPSLGRFQEG